MILKMRHKMKKISVFVSINSSLIPSCFQYLQLSTNTYEVINRDKWTGLIKRVLEMISEWLWSSSVSKMLARHGYKLKLQWTAVKASRSWSSCWPINLNEWPAPSSVTRHCLKRQSRKQLREPEIDLWLTGTCFL